MTGLSYGGFSVHSRYQSKMNMVALLKDSSVLFNGIKYSTYLDGKVYKRLNTKKHSCSNKLVKHTKCVDEFYMNQLNCSLPWLKTYDGHLPKCWSNVKVYDLINVISKVNDETTNYPRKMRAFGCLDNCQTVTWKETRSKTNTLKPNISQLSILIPATPHVISISKSYLGHPIPIPNSGIPVLNSILNSGIENWEISVF